MRLPDSHATAWRPPRGDADRASTAATASARHRRRPAESAIPSPSTPSPRPAARLRRHRQRTGFHIESRRRQPRRAGASLTLFDVKPHPLQPRSHAQVASSTTTPPTAYVVELDRFARLIAERRLNSATSCLSSCSPFGVRLRQRRWLKWRIDHRTEAFAERWKASTPNGNRDDITAAACRTAWPNAGPADSSSYNGSSDSTATPVPPVAWRGFQGETGPVPHALPS